MEGADWEDCCEVAVCGVCMDGVERDPAERGSFFSRLEYVLYASDLSSLSRVNCRAIGPPLLGAVLYAGEVGEGCGWFGEPPVWSRMDAVRCDDAAIAAAEGSRLDESCNVLPSTIVVGERFVGFADPRKRRFVENFRDSPLLFCSGNSSGVGKAGSRSFAFAIRGSTSSLSFLFSSPIRTNSSRSDRTSASRSLIMWMIRAMSSWVGAESWASVSAAGTD